MIILSDDYRNDKSGENNDKFFSESNEIDDFFAQFDEIAEGLNKDDTAGSGNKHTDALSENNSVKSAADADILKEEAIAEFLSSTDAQKGRQGAKGSPRKKNCANSATDFPVLPRASRKNVKFSSPKFPERQKKSFS